MNHHLDKITLAFTAFTLVEVVAAIVINAYSAEQGMSGGFKVRIAVTTLGLVYLAAYSVLLFTHVDPLLWSTVLRGIGLVTWPVVWCWPALASMRQRRAFRRQVEEGGDE